MATKLTKVFPSLFFISFASDGEPSYMIFSDKELAEFYYSLDLHNYMDLDEWKGSFQFEKNQLIFRFHYYNQYSLILDRFDLFSFYDGEWIDENIIEESDIETKVIKFFKDYFKEGLPLFEFKEETPKTIRTDLIDQYTNLILIVDGEVVFETNVMKENIELVKKGLNSDKIFKRK